MWLTWVPDHRDKRIPEVKYEFPNEERKVMPSISECDYARRQRVGFSDLMISEGLGMEGKEEEVLRSPG